MRKKSRDPVQSIDMDMLLSEFKAVAAQAEEEPSVVEEDEPVLVGEAEAKWLEGVGLQSLTEKVRKGKAITPEDVLEQTMGLTATQVQAVKQRVATLNGTIKSKNRKEKVDARDMFAVAETLASQPAAPDSKRLSRILSDGQFEPFTRFFDLSEVDQKQVQFLNLIQLTSVMEASAKATPFRPAKAKKKKKTKEVTVFGARLTELVERDRKLFKGQLVNPHVPMILTRVIDYLTKFGLSGNGLVVISISQQGCSSFHLSTPLISLISPFPLSLSFLPLSPGLWHHYTNAPFGFHP
jgi:hypothetical protein